MSRRLIVSALPGETRAAWLEDGRLCDLIIQRDDKPAVADNLYLGRVSALDKGLRAAFVEIGLDRPGLLPLDKAPKGLSEGDAVIVRVAREPGPDKGARLTARLKPGEVTDAAGRAKPPALLRAADPVTSALERRDAPEEIVIDDPATFARVKAALGDRPEMASRLRLDLDAAPLFERAGVEAEIEALLEPRVALPSGAYLLVEPVQTLTAIDVNTGRHDGRGAPARAVDLEAAVEIPRQLRLRNLSGLIVIDFLELGDGAARKRVTDALRNALKDDPQSGRVQAMRPSGLVEMTRRRAGLAVHELLTGPCGLGGAGRAKDPVTLAFEALRAARRVGAQAPGRNISIVAAPGVVAALEGPGKAARAAVEERLGRAIAVKPRPGHAAFEIVLE
ncbi:MAG: ribonuclease E/G [Kiloniellales bacterium]